MRLGKSETSGGIAKSSQAIVYNWITLIIMQFLHIDHLFSHSFCAIIPSLVSKAVLKEAFYNNNGEANFRSAEINTLNDVSFFVFFSPTALFVHQEGYTVPCDCFNFVFFHLRGCYLMESTCTILVKTFGTLCVSGAENAIQIDPPHPLDSVGCYKSNT